MTKVHLLGANRSYDRSVQTVSVNQVVVLEGYSYDSYVVYEVGRNGWGNNLSSYQFADIRVSYIRPYPPVIGKIRNRNLLR